MTEEEQGKQPKNEGDSSKDSNKNAMKAFYRAMYAGADPDPDDFGISSENQDSRGGVSNAELGRMQNELDEMEKRCQEAENLYKRMAADFENYRKRTQKEKEEFAAVGIQRAVEAILPALDDMDLAVANLNKDMDPGSIIDSLNMVYKRFSRCLEQIGITQLDVIGEQFDPRMHEPVQQVFDDNVPDGSIVFQLRPGYQFNDKILRPSLVNVATGGSEPEMEEVEVEEEIIVEEEVVEENNVEAPVDNADKGEKEVAEEDDKDVDMASTQDIPSMEIQEKLKHTQEDDS